MTVQRKDVDVPVSERKNFPHDSRAEDVFAR